MKYPTADEMKVPSPGRYRVRSAAARLSERFIVEPNGCWRWTGSLTSMGYGHFSIRGLYYQAHRLLYILHRGPIAEGVEPDHLCRNRWCVSPWHLELVTHGVNVQRGSRSRLSADQVQAIRVARANGAGVRALARQYGVNHATVSRIVNGLIWKTPTQEEGQAAA